MSKQGGKLIKQWQKRYFVLKGTLLYWFKEKDDKEAAGCISISNSSVCPQPKVKDHCFGIFQTERKPYFLACENEQEVDEWIAYLSKSEKVKVSIDDFDMLAVVGKGSFGKVMQVRKRDSGDIYALKVLRKDAIMQKNQVKQTQSERAILQRVQHPFIVSLQFAFQSEDKLYMVMDYVNGGELFFHLQKQGRFSESRVRLYTAEIVLAIEHIHAMDIAYRDLKPENILLDSEGHIKITDFGLSKELEKDQTNTFCGSPEYLAPEILQGEGHGKEVDWWSLGTLVFEMLAGLPPFYSENVKVMYDQILHAELNFPAHFSAPARSLLAGFLTRTSSKRLGAGASDAEPIRGHPFFKGYDWQKVYKRGYTPEFVPKVKSDTDINNFDPMFTSEKAEDSFVEKSALGKAEETSFEGFTFVAPSNFNGK